jgi:hypothetical protein
MKVARLAQRRNCRGRAEGSKYFQIMLHCTTLQGLAGYGSWRDETSA